MNEPIHDDNFIEENQEENPQEKNQLIEDMHQNNQAISENSEPNSNEDTVENPPKTILDIDPTSAKERFIILDILRGIAIFGILLMNIQDFAFINGTRNPLYGKEFFPGLINKIVIYGSDFIAREKFMFMFSFLFGVGMAILLEKCISKNVPFAKFFSRRLTVLFLIGMVHGFLIWDGDILMAYALVGFILIAFDKAKPKTILICAICFKMVMVLPMVVGFPLMFTFKKSLHDPVQVEKKFNEQLKNNRESIEKNTKLFGSGDFIDLHLKRIKTAAGRTFAVLGYGWDILALFLFGLWAWKKRIFQDVKENKKLLIQVCRTGFIVGLILNLTVIFCRELASVNYPELQYIGFLAENLAGFAFCFFYISGITLLTQNASFLKILNPFSYVGRTALSNYIFQSVVFTLVFYSYGLGLFGKVSPAMALTMAVGVYIIQIILSKLWLSKYRFGPIEWIWRSMTYGKPQPMKKLDNAINNGATPTIV